MNLVDLVVVVVVALAAIRGLRLGAVVQVLSYGGLLVGLYFGARLASVTVRWVQSQPARGSVALVTMLGAATIGAVAGRIVGNLAFSRVHRGKLGTVDSALGVGVAVVASLLVIWLLASTLVNSSLHLSSSISESRIIRSLDDVLPAPPSVFSAGAELLVVGGLSAGVRTAGSGIRRPGSPCPGEPRCSRRLPTPGPPRSGWSVTGAGRSKRARGSWSAPAWWSPTPT